MRSNAGLSRENDVLSFLKPDLHPLLVGFVLAIPGWQSEHHRFEFIVVLVWEIDIVTRTDREYVSVIDINPFSASQLSTTNFSLYNTYKI